MTSQSPYLKDPSADVPRRSRPPLARTSVAPMRRTVEQHLETLQAALGGHRGGLAALHGLEAVCRELLRRRRRDTVLSRFWTPAAATFVERRPRVDVPDVSVGSFNCLHRLQGCDVRQVHHESLLSNTVLADPTGVGGRPASLPFLCNYCSKPCDAGVWSIYEKPTMQGRWPVRGCFCSPGCVMRFLVSSRMRGADPAWRHNTAMVIRARLKLPPQRAVPIAPPLMALCSHGGHMALEEWRTLAGYGGALPKYDEFTEYAPGALVYGYAATTRTTTLGESNKDDVAHQWRWIRHPVRVPDPEPQVERTSHRTVPPQMQASELTFDPVADGDDRAAAAATVVVDDGGSGSGSANAESAAAAAGTRKRPRPTEQLMQDRTDTLLLRALEAKRARTSGGSRSTSRSTAAPDAGGSTCAQGSGTNVGSNGSALGGADDAEALQSVYFPTSSLEAFFSKPQPQAQSVS